MTEKPRKHNQNNRDSRDKRDNRKQDSSEIQQQIIRAIDETDNSLKDYSVRDLVQQAEEFGRVLEAQKLKTNQIRKFLDAINQLKAKLTDNNFADIKDEIYLLKPKLAYASAKQNSVKSFSKVVSKAIENVHDEVDFQRLAQLIESVIAYHKAAGGE